MAERPDDRLRQAIAVYRVLLLAYPASHRREYGPLMLQLFRDLWRDACRRSGSGSLLKLWVRVLIDLVVSASAAHWQAAKEKLMAVAHQITPMPWRNVLLIVAPGVVFGLVKMQAAAGWLTIVTFVGVAALAFVALVVQKRFSARVLLVLGMLLSASLLTIGFLIVEELSSLRIARETRHLLVSLPLWVAVVALGWKHRRPQSMLYWAFVLGAVTAVVLAPLTTLSTLSIAGLVLLPIALGLPLSRQYGTRTLLFIVGSYSPGWATWITFPDRGCRPYRGSQYTLFCSSGCS